MDKEDVHIYNGLVSHKNKRASLVAQLVKNPPAMHETWVQSLGWEDPLEEYQIWETILSRTNDIRSLMDSKMIIEANYQHVS